MRTEEPASVLRRTLRRPKYAAIDIIMWLTLTDPDISALKPATLMIHILDGDLSQINNCWKCFTIAAMSKFMQGYPKEAVEDFQRAANVVTNGACQNGYVRLISPQRKRQSKIANRGSGCGRRRDSWRTRRRTDASRSPRDCSLASNANDRRRADERQEGERWQLGIFHGRHRFGYFSPVSEKTIHKSEYCFLFIPGTLSGSRVYKSASCMYGNKAN